ncbi:MAG: hypothetical protein HOM25_22215 [Rhodospirillaceae bacterium]|jgi:hypothetical protein|nr:hypothetical protein [Rhodospirillaceae bacterium]MBT5667818.1 hypothetical protein [Rhodospirillaceae bacterium]
METSSEERPSRDDKDSIFILPLSTLPIVSPSLRKARLIKNSQLEGVVELFSGEGTGSGQVLPRDLANIFQFDDKSKKDSGIVQQVSVLPSFDVYSLRIELRKLNIDVDNDENLRLSQEQTRRLNTNMKEFITPLMTTVFGVAAGQTRNVRDLVSLIGNADQGKARQNLMKLSEKLGVHYTAIPNFLQDYGDVYLSLAYYQFCLDQVKPGLETFFECVAEIQRDPQFSRHAGFLQTSEMVTTKFRDMFEQTSSVLNIFKTITDDMWVDISGHKFEIVESSIQECQTKIGAALCALTVKMYAWNVEFPDRSRKNYARQAGFIMGEMRQGIDTVEPIGFVDFSL